MEKLVRKYRKAKGFTLVELLVVIIIIGILAGMMMLSTGSATDKAEATKIVSDMRNIKSACLMFYADENTWPTASTKTASLDKYLDQSMATNYKLVSSDNDGGLRVMVSPDTNSNPKLTKGVRNKLKGIAKDAGLYDSKTSTEYYKGTTYTPCMIVRKSN